MISTSYCTLLKQHRRNHADWGQSAKKQAASVQAIADEYKTRTFLDFGAGCQNIKPWVISAGMEYTAYDPSVPGIDELPDGRFDFLWSTDVMEHVESEYVDETLREMAERTGKVAFVVICTIKATGHHHRLPDGRNAHLTVHPASWWEAKLRKVYGTVTETKSRNGSVVTYVCTP